MDKMKKKHVIVSMMSVATVGLAACGGSGEKADQKDQFSVAMVADKGGIDDKSFNQSAWEGLQAYGKDNKLQKNEGFSYLQSKSQQDYQPNLSRLARGGVDLVFGIGNTFNDVHLHPTNVTDVILFCFHCSNDSRKVRSFIFLECD